MSFLGDVLMAMMIAGGVVLVGLAAAFFVVRRQLRRRWHSVRGHAATRGLLTTWSMAAAWRERVGVRYTPEELSRGPSARVRRRMWVAVEDAEAAVQHADAVNAPVAELPAVCRSLRGVAGDLDQLLRLERRLPLGPARPDGVRTQLAEVIRAARDVQSAALRAAGDATEPQIRSLVRDARDEVAIVAAALSRMRSFTSQ